MRPAWIMNSVVHNRKAPAGFLTEIRVNDEVFHLYPPSIEFNPLSSQEILTCKSEHEPSQVRPRDDCHRPLLPLSIPVQWYGYLNAGQSNWLWPRENLANGLHQAKLPLIPRPNLPIPHQMVDKPRIFLSTCAR